MTEVVFFDGGPFKIMYISTFFIRLWITCGFLNFFFQLNGNRINWMLSGYFFCKNLTKASLSEVPLTPSHSLPPFFVWSNILRVHSHYHYCPFSSTLACCLFFSIIIIPAFTLLRYFYFAVCLLYYICLFESGGKKKQIGGLLTLKKKPQSLGVPKAKKKEKENLVYLFAWKPWRGRD